LINQGNESYVEVSSNAEFITESNCEGLDESIRRMGAGYYNLEVMNYDGYGKFVAKKYDEYNKPTQYDIVNENDISLMTISLGMDELLVQVI